MKVCTYFGVINRHSIQMPENLRELKCESIGRQSGFWLLFSTATNEIHIKRKQVLQNMTLNYLNYHFPLSPTL